MSKSMRVDKGAKSISRAVERNKNVWATVDNVALKYTLSVYLYDAGAGLPKLARECSYENTAIRLNLEYSDILHYYEKTVDNGGKCSFTDSNDVDDMVRQRMEILKNSAASADSVNAKVHLSGVSENESLVYTYIIERSDGRQTFLVITSSITPLNTTLEVIKNQMLLVSVAFVLLSLVFSFYASRRIAKPIAQTNRAAKELAKKNYEIEFNASGYREVEELNNTLNYTKTELAATEKLQRELIANISHDLRTPLTMITGYGEVMRDLPGENTPENIQIIIYSKLVEQEGFDIRFESKEEVFINADELRISQVIYNLVNNAVNHAGEDKTVIITQTVRDKLVRIEVIDHGEGIPADKLPYIWDRYYKVDKEHKRGVIGSGLGLSIVKSILDAHKAHYGGLGLGSVDRQEHSRRAQGALRRAQYAGKGQHLLA